MKRTTRTHGERKQDREARRNFEEAAKKVEWVSNPIHVKIACPCSFRPYPHIVNGFEKQRHDSFLQFFRSQP